MSSIQVPASSSCHDNHLLGGVLARLVDLARDGPQLGLGKLPAGLLQHLERLRQLDEGGRLERGRGRRCRRLGLRDLLGPPLTVLQAARRRRGGGGGEAPGQQHGGLAEGCGGHVEDDGGGKTRFQALLL